MADTARQTLIDFVTRHAIFLGRFSSQVRNKILAALRRSDARLQADLLRRLANVLPEEVNGINWTTRRAQALLDTLRTYEQAILDVSEKTMIPDLQDFAKYEAEFSRDMINVVTQVRLNWVMPSESQLAAVVTSQPFLGKHLRPFLRDIGSVTRAVMQQEIRQGVLEGRTTQQIVRDIEARGIGRTRRELDALVRTSTNHVANAAREKLYAQNLDLIQQVEWVSTIDGRTSIICMSRDGRLYPVDSGPRPPAHPNCRSTTIPHLNPKTTGVDSDIADQGERPFVRDTRTRPEREKAFRKQAKENAGSARWKQLDEKGRRKLIAEERARWTRANVGVIKANTQYSTWLRQQPADFVRDVLGKTRAKLFLDGKLKLERFTDTAGRPWTLEELRRRESAAFKAAGLS